MPLSTEVGLSSGDIVLDGDPATPVERGTVAPRLFDPCLFIVAKRSLISAAAELLLGLGLDGLDYITGDDNRGFFDCHAPGFRPKVGLSILIALTQ